MRFEQKSRRRRLGGLCLVSLILLLSAGAFATSVFAAAEGGHEAEPKGWINTDTYRVINFSILAVGLFLLLRKPVSKALNGRIQSIRDQLSELELRKTEAERQLAEYNEKIARLDQESAGIVDQYIKQAEEARGRIIQEAKETAVKLEEQAKRNIEHEYQKAMAQLQSEVMEKALLQAEQIIQKKITESDQNRLVDEYLDKVVA